MPTTDYPIQPVKFADVRVTGGPWESRIATNRRTTIPNNFRKCEETPRISNFIAAAKKLGRNAELPHPFSASHIIQDDWQGLPFDDSDLYKIMEGASYALAMHGDAKFEAYLDDLIALIAAAQEEDGYLYTPRTAKGPEAHEVVGPERWSNECAQLAGWDSHELYNLGHMYEAAVAHFQATGKRTFLDIALRSADLVASVWGVKTGQLKTPPGHQEVEIGLVKLFQVTGREQYVRLAHFLLECRGRGVNGKTYYSDHLPVGQQPEAVGHSVRSAYMYAAMTDIAAILKVDAYREAVDALWTDVVTTKLFLTGGIGARPDIEGFDKPYELPNKGSYNETCAAIALAFWAHRMFLLHGESKYIDVLERVIYNGFLAGIGLDGQTYFYPNPLAADATTPFNHKHLRRAEWFGCSCCPGNVARFIPSIPGYVYAVRGKDVYVNLYIPSKTTLRIDGIEVAIAQQTDYPWDGTVKITVSPAVSTEFTLRLRIPSFVSGKPLEGDLYRYVNDTVEKPIILVNGKAAHFETANGYAVIHRRWTAGDVITLSLPMKIHRVIAHDNVAANRGRIAVERGPIVFCAEGIDNHGIALELGLSDSQPLRFVVREDLLGGIGVITGDRVALVPYFAWAHCEVGEMAVWLKRDNASRSFIAGDAAAGT